MEARRQPSAEQRERALQAQVAFDTLIVELWSPAERDPTEYLTTERRVAHQPELLERLATLVPDEAIVDYFQFPSLRHVARGEQQRAHLSNIAESACEAWIVARGSHYAIEQLCERVRHLLSTDGDGSEDNRYEHHRFLSPYLPTCLKLVEQLQPTPVALELMSDLLLGKLDRTLPAITFELYNRPERQLYSIYSSAIRRASHVFARQLIAANQLDYEGYRTAVACCSLLENWASIVESELIRPARELSAAELVLREYTVALSHEWIAQLPESAKAFNVAFRLMPRPGADWLLRGLRAMERLGTTAEQINADTPLAQALIILLDVKAIAPAEIDALGPTLAEFQSTTLELALPYAGQARALLLRQLGWGSLLPIEEQIFHISGRQSSTQVTHFDLPHSDDPEAGLIDRAALLYALQAAEAQPLERYLALLKASRRAVQNTLLYLDAVRGIGRAALEKSITKHAQNPLKAYGLLPLQNEAEALARFVTFKRLAKEASQYGAERERNTRAAIQVGLAHLAQTAGFPDLAHLEWTMEARLSDDATELYGTHSVDAWQLHITFTGDELDLRVTKAGKPLKAVPPAVRKSAVHARFKEQQEHVKAQARRFRKALEDMMCAREPLSPEDLRLLSQLPVAQALLQRLILRSEAGALGFLTDDALALQHPDGARQPLSGPLYIAHVFDLFEARSMPAFQRAIIQARTVQPFKQAFRELYLLTPAERETAVYSARFARHAVRSTVANKLLQARGWRVTDEYPLRVSKLYRAAAIFTHLAFEESAHFFTELDTLTTHHLEFTRDAATVPLAEIPPVVFSETMRDLDLLVSVAHHESDNRPVSASTIEQRAALVSALMADLGITSVHCDGHFAHVRGTRANYRIHLGSTAIHIDPGHHVCIIPVSDSDAAKTFLPFADPDIGTSTLVSKVLLLVNDGEITDPTILAQI
jgi:hypothetical protein